jgi:2-polyprenyl-3-methyl-5-hydroxy-6-metoxy-1,4-benzoquinol methylase
MEKWKGECKNRRYLEIGPGFGQYTIRSVRSGLFQECIACDISKTSVDVCKEFMEYCGYEQVCKIQQKNFFDFLDKDKFGFIVMGEVLEHVENPLEMLKQIHFLLDQKGMAFITTVINMPIIDHIYLFDTVESVLDMMQQAGFEIIEFRCETLRGESVEKAIRKKEGITIALLLQK